MKRLDFGGRRPGRQSASSAWLLIVTACFLVLSAALNAQIYRSLDFEDAAVSEYKDGSPNNGYWTLTDAGIDYKVATKWSVSAGIVLPPEVTGKFSRQGKQSLKITMEPNTSGNTPGEKCLIDVCHGDRDTFATRNETRAVAFSIFIPDEYELQDQPLMLSEWWNGNPWVTLSITPDSLNLELLVKNTAESKTIALNRLERNQWHDIILEVTPNAQANGSVRYWCDGELLKTVDDMLIGDGYPRRYFIEVGLYRPACPQRAVAYFDSIRLGRTGAELKEDQGARDPTFSADFISSTIQRVLPLPDGHLLIAGGFSQLQDAALKFYNYGRVARLHADGTIDPTFNPGTGANNTVYDLVRQPDGKIIAAGDFTSFNGKPASYIVRLNANGSLDPSFAPTSGANGIIRTLLLQPDGRILIGGGFTTFNKTAREYLARLNPDGSLDTTFVGPNFAGSSGYRVDSLALQPDGKLLVGGTFSFVGTTLKASLCRIGPNGSLDATFSGVTHGAHVAGNPASLRKINQIAVQPDGQILIVGTFTAFNNTARTGIARLTATGALDNDFAPAPNASAYALLLMPDGRILIGGDFTSINGTTATRIARLQTNGTLDSAFAATGGHAASVYDLALLADGNVLLAGAVASFQNAVPASPLWRLVPGLFSRPGLVHFSFAAVSGVEGNSATLSVNRHGGSFGALTLAYATAYKGGGTATPTADFTGTSGQLNWAAGDTADKTITVPLALDAIADTPETLVVNLGAPLLGSALLGERQQAVITLHTAYSAWQASRFTTFELANPQISGDTADPDSDGLNNLTEFALGREPRFVDSTTAWTTALQNLAGKNYLTITFRRRVPNLDLAYSVQSAPALAGTPVWLSDTLQLGASTPNGDGTETVTYRDATAFNNNAPRFLRVQVTRTP